ncbi:MAG TPA: hypothetical protein VF189_04670 [Patescibacteria group bacterium]
MADQNSAYHEFISKLRQVNEREAQLVDHAFRTRTKEEFLTTFGSALKEHSAIIPQGHNADTLLNSAQQIWDSANPETEEKREESKPVKGASLSDIFKTHEKKGPGYAPQTSSFENDVLKIQKEKIMKKLSGAFEKAQSGQMDTKFLVPALREAINGLSFEKLLSGQSSILQELASNSDFFSNSQEADKKNLLVGIQKAYSKSIDALKSPDNSSRLKQHPDLGFRQDYLLDKLTATLRDVSNPNRFNSILESLSSVIDHQHSQVRRVMPIATQEMERGMPSGFMSFITNLVYQQTITVREGVGQRLVGVNSHQNIVLPQFQRLSAGGVAPNTATFTHRARRGGKTNPISIALNAGGKVIKKLGQEAVKKGISAIFAHPEIVIPVIAIIFAVILAIVIFVVIITFILSIFNFGNSTPTTQALTPSCNPSTQCLVELKSLGINLSGDLYLNGDSYGKAKPIYEVIALVTQPPSDFGKLLGLPQKHINIVLHGGGGCAGHANYSGTLDYYGWCNNEIINKFMILHELGHEIAFRNPVLYWTKFALPYMLMSFVFRNMPTYNCQLDYGPGPWVAECWADMIGEYVYYPQYRVTVSGRPSGTYNFPSFPNFANSFYYGFARDNIYNGLNFQAPKPSPTP